MNPDDPAWHVEDFEGSEDNVYIFDARHNKRATVQRWAADELGMDFREMRCVKRYIRLLTRQELWNDYGRDRGFEAKLFQAAYGYYFTSAGYGPEGWYCDITKRRVPSTKIETLREPARVPDDWNPTSDMPGFCMVAPDHQQAIPVWYVEPW